MRELAKWIKLSESHVYFMVNKNKIPFAKLGGKLLFDKEKIRLWIEENSSNTPKVKRGRKKIDQVVPLVEKSIPEPETTETILLENLSPKDIDVLD